MVSYVLLLLLVAASHQSVRSDSPSPCEPGFERSTPTSICLPIIDTTSCPDGFERTGADGPCLPIINSGTETETETQTQTQTETETGTQTQTETETGTETQTQTETETGTCTNSLTHKGNPVTVLLASGEFTSCVVSNGITYCISDAEYQGNEACKCLTCDFSEQPPSCRTVQKPLCDTFLGPYTPPNCGGSASCTSSGQGSTTDVTAVDAGGGTAELPSETGARSAPGVVVESSSSTTSWGATAVALIVGSALMGLALTF